ncbi:group II intron maturase-specific domain-containing protein [Caballeronia sp. BCC1704]|uniref:group II intron maturase-specific domain-containing protein n=1 Tax=Caballeronia sp. BCC1704 TaxID=2676300 RepID=UPI002445E8BA|nr:group II intron maturase-specific domain-containing protein [Caballeronia sp. BCC1704]
MTLSRQETTELVGKLNRTLRGWANYFQVGSVSRAFRAIESYIFEAGWLPRHRPRASSEKTCLSCL